MFGTLATGIKDLGFRFTATALLPFLVLATFAFGLTAIATGGANQDPLSSMKASAAAVGPVGGVALLLVSFVLALVTQPFQVAFVRLVEGYWGASSVASLARAIGVELQRRRRHRIRLAMTSAHSWGDRNEASYYEQRLARYPIPADMLPTLLGNTLRAGERRAGERYGLDTVRVWSRLYYLLPDSFQRDVADLHGQVDAAARLTVALALSGTAAAPVLLPHGLWNIVTVCTFLLAVVAYRGGVTAATGLATVLSASFDLNRFDLLAALHMPLPTNFTEETETNRQLDRFLDGSASDPLLPGKSYEHP